MPLETELVVWDLFLIKGATVLFRVAITIFQLMEKEILQQNDFAEIYMIVEKFGQKIDQHTLLSNLYPGISN